MKRFHFKRFGVAAWAMCMAWSAVSGQDELSSRKNELAALRQQGAAYEKELKKQSRDEAVELKYLANLNKEIDLTRMYVTALNRDLRRLEQQVGRRGQEIDGLDAERRRLREVVKKRVVQFYKHRRAKEIEWLLSIQSWDQLKAWMKYEKLIADNDRRNLQALQDRGQALQREQSFVRIEMQEKARSLQEKRREEDRLQSSLQKRQALLINLQKNKKLVQSRLAEIKASEKEIGKLIAQAEKARKAQAKKKSKQPGAGPAPAQTVVSGHQFSDLKGRMSWPTTGTIVSHFGRERHPALNTVTENLGIEIKAQLGNPVITVDDGVVQTITWQRSRGNIIIISHDNGFYTVYTHLQDIRVAESQPVKRGQTIGTVGDTGSLIGPVLHFQIWKNTTNLNPEEWLG